MPNSLRSTVQSLHSELIAAGEGLAGNEDVLRSVLAGCGDCIKILDLDGRLQFMSEGGKRVMEVEDFGALKGCPWPDFWAGDGNAAARNAVEAARQGEVARFKGAADTAKGNPRYWDVQVSPIFDADGKPSHILSISRDITLERRAEAEIAEAHDRQKVLTEELQHRIKNTLAMVAAIANQTMRGDSVAAAREAFTARLVTFSNAHDILTQTSWQSAPVKDVVEGALAPHRSARGHIEIGGPQLLLLPKQALTMALVVHELATNATKYGSLSVENGKVDIAWSTGVANDVPAFEFLWTETGGPAVVEPPQSQIGFGSRLIDRMLKGDFGGDVMIKYDAGGVVCKFTAPLSNILSAPA